MHAKVVSAMPMRFMGRGMVRKVLRLIGLLAKQNQLPLKGLQPIQLIRGNWFADGLWPGAAFRYNFPSFTFCRLGPSPPFHPTMGMNRTLEHMAILCRLICRMSPLSPEKIRQFLPDFLLLKNIISVLAPRHRLPVPRVEHLAFAAVAKDGDAFATQIVSQIVNYPTLKDGACDCTKNRVTIGWLTTALKAMFIAAM